MHCFVYERSRGEFITAFKPHYQQEKRYKYHNVPSSECFRKIPGACFSRIAKESNAISIFRNPGKLLNLIFLGAGFPAKRPRPI